MPPNGGSIVVSNAAGKSWGATEREEASPKIVVQTFTCVGANLPAFALYISTYSVAVTEDVIAKEKILAREKNRAC